MSDTGRERRDGHRTGPALDPGAFIGHEPELASDTIPGGVRPGDERVAAHSTQGTGAGRPERRGQPPVEATGHRDADTPDERGDDHG